jgi:hypothetical protein
VQLQITILSKVGIQIDVPDQTLTFVAVYQQPIASQRGATKTVPATISAPAGKPRAGDALTIALVFCAAGSVITLVWLLIRKKQSRKVKVE